MIKGFERLTDWEPGVTATWTECPHGERILTGTYLRGQVPTGVHPECLARLMDEQEAEERRAERAELTAGEFWPVGNGY